MLRVLGKAQYSAPSRKPTELMGGTKAIRPCRRVMIVNALENRYISIFKQSGAGIPVPPGSKEVSPLLNCVNDIRRWQTLRELCAQRLSITP